MRTMPVMRTVESIRTLLFLPTWIGSAWALHRFAEWGWLGAIAAGFALTIVVMIAVTLVVDRMT